MTETDTTNQPPQVHPHVDERGALGVQRLAAMLPATAAYLDPRDDSARDTCAVCGDVECGGACPGAVEVVRQVIMALGSSDDDWDWWREWFADDSTPVPDAQPRQACLHTCHLHKSMDCWDEDCETCGDCPAWPCGPDGKPAFDDFGFPLTVQLSHSEAVRIMDTASDAVRYIHTEILRVSELGPIGDEDPNERARRDVLEYYRNREAKHRYIYAWAMARLDEGVERRRRLALGKPSPSDAEPDATASTEISGAGR